MYTALKSSKKKRKIHKYEGGEPFFFSVLCDGHSGLRDGVREQKALLRDNL